MGARAGLWRWRTILALVLASLCCREVSANCACKFQGRTLPVTLYTNYPLSEPGKYGQLSAIGKYGTMCAAWDQMPGTPSSSTCPAGADFSLALYSWCQVPWCYVDASCTSKIATAVFQGSDTAYYSYEPCGGAPDCRSPGPLGEYGRGTAGCPYDPNGDGSHRVYKASCACKHAGGELPASLYTDYPEQDPGRFKDEPFINLYGTTCAAWDQTPDTPWKWYCPDNSDWCHPDYNWCQAPWCYVDESCPTKIATQVFKGAATGYFSYDTCRGTPDCRNNQAAIGAACPFDSADSSWYTSGSCPSGWSAAPTANAAAARGDAATAAAAAAVLVAGLAAL